MFVYVDEYESHKLFVESLLHLVQTSVVFSENIQRKITKFIFIK